MALMRAYTPPHYTFTFKVSMMFVLLLLVLLLMLTAATFPPAQASISQPRVAAPTLYYGVHDISTAPKIINMTWGQVPQCRIYG